MWSFATQRRTITSSSSRHSCAPGSGTGTRLPRGREFAGWAWTRDSDVLGGAELPLAVRQSLPDGARGALPGQDDKAGAGRREVEIADGCRWPCTAVRSPCRDWLAAAPSEEPSSKHRGRGHPPGFAILFAQASCALRPEAPRDSSPRAPSHASIAGAATTPEHQSPAVSTPRRRSRPRPAPPAAPALDRRCSLALGCGPPRKLRVRAWRLLLRRGFSISPSIDIHRLVHESRRTRP